MSARRFIAAAGVAAMLGAVGPPLAHAGPVTGENGKIYIVDQRGERWDVTEAESLGFDPRGFQYGVGRNAFTPLDDSLVGKRVEGIPGATRVIGVREGTSLRAYSVPTLRSHEVANSNLGGKPIAVGY